MRVRTGIKAGGSNADNHQFGPVIERGKLIGWQFSISRSWRPGFWGRILRLFGLGGRHVFSPPMSQEKAMAGARALAQGDVEGARAAWGGDVAGWLDSMSAEAREALFEAAREMGGAP